LKGDPIPKLSFAGVMDDVKFAVVGTTVYPRRVPDNGLDGLIARLTIFSKPSSLLHGNGVSRLTAWQLMTPATLRGGRENARDATERSGSVLLPLSPELTEPGYDMRDKSDQRHEPSLEELLSDPIIWTVMKSDKVEEHELRNLLKHVAAELAAGSDRAAGNEVSIEDDDDGAFRKGVGIMLLNDRNEVFVGQRVDAQHEAWQMPQGGIDGDEDPRAAALRELKEEVGTDKVHVIAESKNWLRYELPPEMRERWGERSRWRGQQQKWFVMRFNGTDGDINIAGDHPEFSAWKWVPIEQLPDLIVSFKRQLYLDVVCEFRQFGPP